ncbi:MAG: NTP transferase domain-containing protein [Oscillospiraceae bacterium]|nr:NTP transferase domain-containing protein [Oscillospiraceae bacterium]
MDNQTTLLIMAAGMGSRFGGLKQMEPVGPNGEILMDYSVYDAQRAGFDRTVIIIRRDFEQEFRRLVGRRMENMMDVDYAFQTMDDMPQGRTKPWGTAFAILCAEPQVNTPFCVINADDFYGRDAFAVMHRHLRVSGDYAMVGYLLENTLSESGTVSRGICEVEDGCLKGVTEHLSIPFRNEFPKGTVASMNMFGFQPNLFAYLREGYAAFMRAHGLEEKSEYLIPRVVDELIKSGRERMRVLETDAKWYGVTHREDLPGVAAAIGALAYSF